MRIAENMQKTILQGNKAKAYKIIYMQIMLTVILSMLFLLITGQQAAWSACFGGLIAVLPGAVFIRFFFAKTGAQQSKAIMTGLFKGEAIKIALTVILFILVIKFTEAQPLVVLIAFIINQLTFWVAPLIMKT